MIYQALYIQSRGALKRELVACRRTGRALRVPRARTRQKAWAHVTHEVMISLDAATVATLREHRKRQAAERLLMGTGWTGHGLVFCRVDGGLLHPERFSRSFGDRVRQLGLPRVRLHDLRHGWATMALGAGVHPKVVQERLGHANIGITLDVYSHVTAGLHDDAAERVASLVFDNR